MKQNPNIVVIGGGSGNFTLLTGLKHKTTNLTALVNMADDGGSSGVLRDQFGVLPPGDIRQCLVALSKDSEPLRELFNYRYPKPSDLAGHSFGNLFLSTLELVTKDFSLAVEQAGKILQITGQVIPITLEKCNLAIETDGGRLVGEFAISKLKLQAREDPPKLALQPRAALNPAAKKAIRKADLIVIAPGDLYGSLAPALLTEDLYKALRAAQAPCVYVCNLVNKPHQTADFTVADYTREINRLAGGTVLDYVLYNTDVPTKAALKQYALDGELPVSADASELAKLACKAVGMPLLARITQRRNPNDHMIKRSLIRHDSARIADALMGLLP